MSSKKIYLIRHGQTDFNRLGIVQGSGVDSHLNDFGLRQAEAFFQTYKHIPLDKVYTSVLQRSIESVKGFLDKGVPHEALAGLNEISWGKKEGQPITQEEDAYYHDMLNEWQKGNTSRRIEGGESPEDVVARLAPAVAHIMSQDQEKVILVCMHGRAMRILLCYLLQYPLSSMDYFKHANMGLYLLNYESGVFHLELVNDISHLRELS